MDELPSDRPAPLRELRRGDALARHAVPGEEDAILEVLEASFDRWPPFAIGGTSRDFLDWYFEPHSTTQGQALITEIDGRIASVNIRMLRPALVAGSLRPALLGAYVATHPNFRGRGVYRLLSDFGDAQGHEFAWHMTQVAEVKGIAERAGFHALVNPYEVHVAMLKAPSVGRPVRPAGLAKSAGYGAAALWSVARRRGRSAVDTCTVRRAPAFDERVNELWERAANEFYFIPLRDAEFLNWRYFDQRAGLFTVCVAEERDDLLGYVVLRIDGPRAHIVDLLVDPSRPDALQNLIAAALREAQMGGADSVECWMFRHHPYRDALLDGGFVRFPSRSKRLAGQIRIESFGVDRGTIAFLDSPLATIHIMEGDTDLT